MHGVVPFIIIPIFGFANAGLSLASVTFQSLARPVTLGVGAGLVLGKVVGVFVTAWVAVKAGLADAPANAFPDSQALQDATKLGILAGSLVSAVVGSIVLMFSPRPGSEALIYALNERYLDALAARIETTCRAHHERALRLFE